MGKVIFILVSITCSSFAQSGLNKFLTPSDSLHKPRRNAVIITETSLATLSLVALNELWYADFERSKFHTVNDNNEWLQMDKMGHAFSSYQMGKISANLLNWSGATKKDRLIYGASLSLGYLTAVEILDGYSEEWGFSWGDMLANVSGTSLYIFQEMVWNEQRIALKYSFHETNFSDKDPDKLGESMLEQLLKDYNGQTYWLSLNIRSFIKSSKIPKWLNLAIGYGGEGMLGNDYYFQNIDNQYIKQQERYRQLYLSLDLNLEFIPTNSKILSTVFSVVNVIKIPFPTLEFNKNGLAFHLFYY